MAITWMKAKYARPKSKGGYKSHHNDQGTKHAHKHKATEAQRADMKARQPKVVKVLTASGKTVYRHFHQTLGEVD